MPLHALALLAGWFLFGGAHSAVHAQSGDDVLERLRATYREVQSVRADFTQTMSSEYSGETVSSSGVVYLQGEKYRVETSTQTLVTDGKVTWVYVPADRQVLVNDYVHDETTFTLNDFIFDRDERYRLAGSSRRTLQGQAHHVLVLEPKERDAFFTKVTLTVRAADHVITHLDVEDVNGTKMAFALQNVQLNPKLGSSVFTFVPPRDVEVVDLRS